MHILVTNDDGPPSQQSSPYVHSLVDTFQKAGHQVSVVLPDRQRSWIGKAHIVGQMLKPTYFRPGPLHTDDGKVRDRPSTDGLEDWILLNGTPASCVQVALYHFFEHKGPIDMVVSGPNYGRNTTALFSLSSGTIGGAMEGAVCGKKAIALSYAFDGRIHDPVVIQEASQQSVKLIEYLYKHWPESGVDLYSINVPLQKGVSSSKILYTGILQNRWSSGSSYKAMEVGEVEGPGEHESAIRSGEDDFSQTRADEQIIHRHRHFVWSPRYKDVYDSVDRAGEGSDGWAVKEGFVSVTPLKANFWHAAEFTGEIRLESHRKMSSGTPGVLAFVDYPDPYVQPLIVEALRRHMSPISIEVDFSQRALPSADAKVLQIGSYETLDFEHALSHPSSYLINSYIIRKALIRKHYLSHTIHTWITKHPDSLLKHHFKPPVIFELDYAEFLDDALLEAYELHQTFESNADKVPADRDWWILKPGMSDGGNGIRLFSSFEELQAIFEDWDPPVENEEEEQQDEQVATTLQLADKEDDSSGMTSQLRHFIAQPYIHPPLLLPSKGKRKFHLRVYVLAIGSLQVYVYREALALFAARPYLAPGMTDDLDLASHLTNTCFQDESTKDSSVFRFWSLEDPSLDDDWKKRVFKQICAVCKETFEAAARDQRIHFQTLPNAFEIFGVDFLIDRQLEVWLLEVNAFPDFKQTGEELQDIVIGGLFDETILQAVKPFFGDADRTTERDSERMTLVCDLDLGIR